MVGMIFETLYIHLFDLLFGPASVRLRRCVRTTSVASVEEWMRIPCFYT